MAVADANYNFVYVDIGASPDGKVDIFLDLLDSCLNYLLNALNPQKIVLCGDFNIHLECHSRDEELFSNLLRSYGLYFTTRQPTREQACLDSIATNVDSWDWEVCIREPVVADHSAVLVTINSNKVSPCSNKPAWYAKYVAAKRSINDNDMPLLCHKLLHAFRAIPNADNCPEPEVAFNIFFDNFMDNFNQIFPLKVMKAKPRSSNKTHTDKSWYTQELAKLRSYICILHDFYKTSTVPERKERLYALYRQTKRLHRCKVNEAKKDSNVLKIKEASNTCKAAWDIINSHRSPKPKTVTAGSPDDFNNFFSEIANKVVDDLPILQTDPADSLLDVTSFCSLNHWNQVSPSFIIKLVKGFKNSNSQDVFGVSCSVLKAVTHTIVDPLTTVVNLCLRSGCFPDALKTARAIPVFKKGDPSLLSNYRPIAILPALSKVIESVMKIQLIKYFESNHLLADAQHGFRKGRSTTTALSSLVEQIADAFEAKDSVLLNMCDLSKAFDVVSHKIIVSKLKKYGVTGVVLQTIISYLEGRKQVVSLGGATSGVKLLRHGVPQGSVLGPLLFTIVINDLALNNKTLLFADDTTLVTRGRDLNQLSADAECLLFYAKEWFSQNLLKINDDKTQTLLCTLKPNYLGEEAVKLLGFWIDSKLSWKQHIGQIQKGYPYYTSRLYNTLPSEVRELDVKAFRDKLKDYLVRRPLYSLTELEDTPLFGNPPPS
ncbi:uncharacterized protein LOC128984072 [Macrosteles quadrilineatus]|uniref:uncharacterized protein LOC128984072 n=1 Tax=Macrosteles quadrilineatus TaxID=74068 RepID=UPI0023E27694|nr:uncharacterized protein LOC128984072 [Macrosteles quadrilineatus]